MADSKLNELSLITTPTMNSPLYTVESSSDKRMLVKDISQVIGDENIAPAYDATETYSEGDFVSYDGTLYQCNTAIATPEAFDATKWDAVKVTEISSGAFVIQLTQAEYTALSTAEKMNGSIYKLTDKAIFYCLDEEYHPVKELTTAQYEALTTAEQNNGSIYIQTDAETTAADIPYSSGVSVADKLNTIPTSYTYDFRYNSVDYYIKKYGDVVYLYLNGSSQTTYSTSWTEIATLPSNLVPSQILFFGALIPDNHVIMFRLLTDGKLYARCDTTANVYPQGSSVYMLI